ncbi:DUF4124 domain-containing protein [Pseudoduganella buxea]|uniref:DUF4124 domain-containing protein n=1 Tax=Pseudoduganella buxea TaxID=1949069 RepID=A0A6I3SY99_9BURK|nr:DUF4124 domain-containing protein [Pseudoduganella buxea]MTV54188.1 DUF4124 domain-containing protein [Pseudoduganella buxea]GGC22467.1 hypothetical protein GCM10011572_49930 [Pseudoduganella buxea]
MKIRRFPVPLAVLPLLFCSGLVQAQIYRCVDAAGHKEYTDRKKGSHCVALDLPDPVIAAPPKREAAPRPRAPASPATTAATAPSAFPRVDSAEQKARDADRRQILTDELNAEMQKLGELRREYNNGEPERRGDERNYAKYQERVANLKGSIARSEQNVEALKREIANIR